MYCVLFLLHNLTIVSTLSTAYCIVITFCLNGGISLMGKMLGISTLLVSYLVYLRVIFHPVSFRCCLLPHGPTVDLLLMTDRIPCTDLNCLFSFFLAYT